MMTRHIPTHHTCPLAETWVLKKPAASHRQSEFGFGGQLSQNLELEVTIGFFKLKDYRASHSDNEEREIVFFPFLVFRLLTQNFRSPNWTVTIKQGLCHLRAREVKKEALTHYWQRFLLHRLVAPKKILRKREEDQEEDNDRLTFGGFSSIFFAFHPFLFSLALARDEERGEGARKVKEGDIKQLIGAVSNVIWSWRAERLVRFDFCNGKWILRSFFDKQ